MNKVREEAKKEGMAWERQRGSQKLVSRVREHNKLITTDNNVAEGNKVNSRKRLF